MVPESSLLEFCFLYNSFAKRGTVLFIGEGALRTLVGIAKEGYGMIPAIVVEVYYKIQSQRFASDESIVLQVEVDLRRDGISIEKVFAIACRYVPEFRYFSVYSVSEKK